MTLFMGMGGVGKDFEKGLNLLKNIVENEKEIPMTKKYEIKQIDFSMRNFVAVKGEISMSEVTAHYMENFPKIFAAVQGKGAEMAGMPCGLFYSWDDKTGETEMAAAIPVRKKTNIDAFESIEINAEKALQVDFYGPYHEVRHAHEAIDEYTQKNGVEVMMPVIEEYVTDPSTEPDTSKWLTRVYYPVKQ